MDFCRMHLVYYDCWNSVWTAVFQDGKTLFHAIWCECDRIKEKIKKKDDRTVITGARKRNGLLLSSPDIEEEM